MNDDYYLYERDGKVYYKRKPPNAGGIMVTIGLLILFFALLAVVGPSLDLWTQAQFVAHKGEVNGK